MRLIDADGLIKKAYRSEMWNRSTQAFDLFVVDAEDVEDAPTIDAVEVVRCKDCVYWKPRHIKENLLECTHCKHNVSCSEILLGCDVCDNSECPCSTCVDLSNWQWRGV